MDFIRQLVSFHRKGAGNLTPNAIAIYHYLFMTNNSFEWAEWFEVSDYWLGQAVGIKRRETIVSALNLLKQKGFIEFERGGAHKPTRYHIIPLFNSANNSAFDSAISSAFDSAIHSSNNSAKNVSLLSNIKNKTKKKNRDGDARAKFVPPTLDQVNEYVMEKKLCVSAKKFFDYYEAGGWKDGKGNPVKNWKQKILTWDAHEPRRELSTNISTGNPQNPQKAIDDAIEYFENREEGMA